MQFFDLSRVDAAFILTILIDKEAECKQYCLEKGFAPDSIPYLGHLWSIIYDLEDFLK